MPKRGKGHKSWIKGRHSDDSKTYYEHDDRDFPATTRKVTFKASNKLKQRRLDGFSKVQHLLLDDDIDMPSGSGHYESTHRGNRYERGGRFGRRGGQRGRMGSNVGYQNNRLFDQTGWFRVFIPYGSKHEKNLLLGVLQSNIAPHDLLPIDFRVEENDVIFYVDDLKVAEALSEADRKISLDGGRFKLSVRVSSGMPRVDMNDNLKERIKLAMVKRYNASTQALDLAKFHRDSDLIEDSICALSRPQVITTVLQIISDNIPELQALNLDSNCLFVSDTLGSIPRKLPNLKILYLGFNRFRDIGSLSILKGLSLVELKLEGNPLCKKFTSKEDYKSLLCSLQGCYNIDLGAVRKIFPKLVKLDGIELPPAISFEVEEAAKTKLPSSIITYVCTDNALGVARQFIEQYFAFYDAGEGATRQPLLEAYHDCAVFSLISIYPPGQGKPDGPKLNTYISESRNLLRTSDMDRRMKLLKYGKLSIVGFICELPKTQHDASSFTLDLTVCSPNLLTMTLTGVFKELGVKSTPIRYFVRKFILVPVGAGFCIINEMLYVTNASHTQIEKAFKAPAITTPISSPVASSSVPVSSPQLADPQQQQQAIEALAAQTNMNFMWARKCLEETFWNLEQAFGAFSQLNAQGRVPPEAFLK